MRKTGHVLAKTKNAMGRTAYRIEPGPVLQPAGAPLGPLQPEPVEG